MPDSYRFNLVNRSDELLAYSRNYHERFGGPTKESIIKLLREEFGPGHCTVRRKRLVYTKNIVTKKDINN
mgnify:FL=1|tara:strand:+ start:155 stop:364 length:210 start_codon:yes stop_codon:yes gene_type:complete